MGISNFWKGLLNRSVSEGVHDIFGGAVLLLPSGVSLEFLESVAQASPCTVLLDEGVRGRLI